MPLQSSLDENWWADSMECHCYLRDVLEFLADERTTFELRFGEPFKGPVIPFGAMVEYPLVSAKDHRLHQFGENVLLEYSSDMHCFREKFVKERYFGCRH